MKRTYTCIVCPRGCEIETEYEGKNVFSVTGNGCKRGEEYVKQELTDPRRTIASSVLVKGGVLPLASVRLNRAVPKDRIFDVMFEIKNITLEAPVYSGTVLIPDILGLGADVIATKDVAAQEEAAPDKMLSKS